MSYRVPKTRRTKPCRFRNLIPIEVQELTNGCGGKGGWFKGPGDLFCRACKHHDFNYWLGGTEDDRLKADWQFYIHMCEEAASHRSWWTKTRKKALAWIYYRAVRHFGSRYFVYNPKQDAWTRLESEMSDAGYRPDEAYFE